MEITSQDVFVVVDVQNDFCPGGALAVPAGDSIIDSIHRAALRFEHIILTQDWHPPGHSSFASAHLGRAPLETVKAAYGPQTLWPDHCVQGTPGAEFHSSLQLQRAELILRKGQRAGIDSYSAFFENDRVTATGLNGYLRERGLRRIFFAGLAYDFCVGYSALDARQLGFDSIVFSDACRAIDMCDSVARMEEKFKQAGVSLIHERAE